MKEIVDTFIVDGGFVKLINIRFFAFIVYACVDLV